MEWMKQFETCATLKRDNSVHLNLSICWIEEEVTTLLGEGKISSTLEPVMTDAKTLRSFSVGFKERMPLLKYARPAHAVFRQCAL